MAPEIASWDTQNSPGRPEAHPGRALALPAPRKAPGSVRAAADCTSPGGHPGGATAPSACQPSSPKLALATLLTTTCSYWYLLFPRPHTLDGVGGYEMACGHCRRPRKKQTYHTAFINVAGSRGTSRLFPRKTLSHNFHHRGCIPRRFSYVLVAPTTGLLKNPSSCTAAREPGREPSREPSETQPPH